MEISEPDVDPPEISLNSPGNNSQLTRFDHIDFEITDDNSFYVKYSVNHGLFMTFEPPYQISAADLEEGMQIITVRADDISGNINEKWFSFEIDIIVDWQHNDA